MADVEHNWWLRWNKIHRLVPKCKNFSVFIVWIAFKNDFKMAVEVESILQCDSKYNTKVEQNKIQQLNKS